MKVTSSPTRSRSAARDRSTGTTATGTAETGDDTANAVLVASRALVAVAARSIANAKGVTLPQFRMLVMLSAHNANLTELAASLDVAPSTALRMVDRLVASGLVQRTVRPENRRETILSLTTAGRRSVRTMTARRLRDINAVIQRIDPTHRAALIEAMSALSQAADELWPGIVNSVP